MEKILIFHFNYYLVLSESSDKNMFEKNFFFGSLFFIEAIELIFKKYYSLSWKGFFYQGENLGKFMNFFQQ